MKAGHGQFDQRPSDGGTHPVPSRHSFGSVWLLLFGIFLLSLNAVGCSRLRLPAIDPNGSRIFLPFPNTTGLALPDQGQPGQTGIFPTPAFAEPTTPPPCVDGSVCNLMGEKHQLVSRLQERFSSPGEAGEIQLTPRHVLAPVGGEVVLLAGICGPDGYLVKGEPLEWMLSPDSVGTFIDVGDDRPGKLTSLLRHDPKVEKLDVDFARGRTSSKPQLITRGSPGCDDDIPLKEGQTWLSISSPSEGISRVTVLAPDSQVWDRRYQTTTIYWVDAQAQFPTPRIVNSGRTVELVTRVTKAENMVPAEDWIVNYTIVDPSIATFVPPTGSNQAVVKVNSDGQAIATLAALPGKRGTTPVMIEVVRPAQPSDNLPAIPIDRRQTFVTFSAPGLTLQAFGPELGSVGEQLTYNASLGNPGDIDAENARMLVNIPAGTRLIQSIPEPSQSTDTGLIWEQGILAANRQLDVTLILEPLQTSTYDVVFQAAAEGGLSDQSSVRTEIIAASVDVKFAPAGGVAQAEVGNQVQYEIDVTNNGRQSLTDLQLVIETSPGLPEAYQGVNKVEQAIPMLLPSETRKIGATFQVQQEGQLVARLTVRSGNNILAEKSASILGLPEKPKEPAIGVSIRFPETIRVGGRSTAEVTVRNPGEVKLTDIQVQLSVDPTLAVTRVDNANLRNLALSNDGLTGTWSAQDLLPRMPGDSGDVIRRLFVEFESKAPVEAGRISVRATSAENVQSEDSAQFRAIGNEVTPPAPVTPPARETLTGELEVELIDYRDPANIGSEIRYDLIVTNGQNQPNRNVRVMLRLPEGVQIQQITSGGTQTSYEFIDKNTIALPDIQYLRSTDNVTYTLVLIPQVPQLMELRARVYSDQQPTPSEASETTTVNARAQ